MLPIRAYSNTTTNSPTSAGQAFASRGQDILRAEAAALSSLADRIGNKEDVLADRFHRVVDLLRTCPGCVVTTGIGKAGIVGHKFSASLSSTGTPSHFLHPSEAIHGDLGSVRTEDVVVLLSYSGETEEVVRLLSLLNATAASTIAITARDDSTLARSVDVALPIGKHAEACSLGLAPSTSTTLMMGLCDALALVTSESRQFSREQFARFHPGGSLGRELALVQEAMRPKDECRLASQHMSVREVLVEVSRPGRRTGAVMLLDDSGKLAGIFTDSDLARMLEQQKDDRLDDPIEERMVTQFHTVLGTSRFSEAVRIMSEYKISELPVVDAEGYPLGIVDITDVVGAVPKPDSAAKPRILSLDEFRRP